MNAAREDILGRIRATAQADADTFIRAYRRSGRLAPTALLDLFAERIGDYRADVRRVAATEIAAAAAGRFVVPAGLPEAWRPAGAIEDRELSTAALDALDGAVTGCTVAIAETGTLVLAAGPAEGRRALTLIPDTHVCVVLPHQIVETVPEAFAALRGLERRPLTFVSGPSATSDIELERVEGVHGPRNLIVLIVDDEGVG